MQAVSLFRRCKSIVDGVRITDEKALVDSTLRPQMITLENVTGMELPTGPYTFRRGNGEALDNSSELHVELLPSFRLTGAQAFITESQRNPGPATSHQRTRYPNVCSALRNMQGLDLSQFWFILNVYVEYIVLIRVERLRLAYALALSETTGPPRPITTITFERFTHGAHRTAHSVGKHALTTQPA